MNEVPVSASFIEDGLSRIADKIREVGGTSASLAFPEEFVLAIDAIGGDVDADKIAMKTISGKIQGKASHIITAAFSGFSLITEADFSECSVIGHQAFYGCSELKKASFPACTQIESDAFARCTTLTEIYAPNCTAIPGNAFDMTWVLSNVSFPLCSVIGPEAFFYGGVETAYFPECTYIGPSAFVLCPMYHPYFPKCSVIMWSAFSYCACITASFPVCERIESCAFIDCRNLREISFPACTYIGISAFLRCSKLDTAYFLGSSVPTMATAPSRIFVGTPLYSGQGVIYVMPSMYSKFASTAWSYFINIIQSYTESI